MTTIAIEISGPAAEKLLHLVEAEHRSEAEIVCDAPEAYGPQALTAQRSGQVPQRPERHLPAG